MFVFGPKTSSYCGSLNLTGPDGPTLSETQQVVANIGIGFGIIPGASWDQIVSQQEHHVQNWLFLVLGFGC